MIGNYYKNATDFYGAYPHSYLDRVLSMFPDAINVLHLFSGSLPNTTKGITFDINPKLNPMVVGDAHQLSHYFPENVNFELILADGPYSREHALHYGTPMIHRYKVVSECVKVLAPGGFLIWLDQVFPMFSKKELELVGTIGLIRSTNHRVRCIFIFRKLQKGF